MAWIFELVIEAGFEKSAAEAAQRCFQGQRVILKSGKFSVLESSANDIWKDTEDNWWCRIVPSGASATGRSDRAISERKELLELASGIYDRLKSVQSYRLAMVGWEKSEPATLSEIVKELSTNSNYPGLVVSSDVWEMLGKLSQFEPFSAGFYWQRMTERIVIL